MTADAMGLQPGQLVYVEANQGTREALVLAVLGDEALLEYEMPKGTTALRLVAAIPGQALKGAGGRPYLKVSYAAVPGRWLQAIASQGQRWIGKPQSGGFQLASEKYRLPTPTLARFHLCPEEREKVCRHGLGFQYKGDVPNTGPRRCNLCRLALEEW
jgi:hypothetical protein